LASKDKLVLKSVQLDIMPFSTKAQRPEMNSNNLYLKNIPKMTSEEASTKLK